MKKWGEELSTTQRMQLKLLVCILGCLLLVILLLATILRAFMEREEPEYKPLLRNLVNVWIMEVNEDSIMVFDEGQQKTYQLAEGVHIIPEVREQLANVRLADEKVTHVICKKNKINGKVLSADSEGVTLEEYGWIPLSPSVRGYRLYGTLTMLDARDIMIGYDFTDFVIENGEICGILAVKEEKMEYIRVLVKTSGYQELLHNEIVFTCDTDYVVRYGAYGQQAEAYHRAGEVCSIGMDSSLWTENRIVIEPTALTGKVTLQNVERSHGSIGYRGNLEMLRTDRGIAAVNEVLLEEYLYSVVPSEMPSTYPAEALKAQAITARTYAYRSMLHAGYPEFGAHVDDSTRYQVYHNTAEQETTTAAVKETYGQVLFAPDGQSPAETYYYSTSCGIGSSADVWRVQGSSDLDYLSPKLINREAVLGMDQGNYAVYEQQAGKLREEEAFAAFITSVNPSDYESEEGWYRWSYAVETVDPAVLRDRMVQRYEVSPTQILTLNKAGEFVSRAIGRWETIQNIAVTVRGPGGVAQELTITTDADTYKIITEYSIRFVLCDGVTQVRRQNGSLVNAATILPSGFFVVDVVKEKNAVAGYTLTGGGYGHGVGMSQNGARSMAASGITAQDILCFFYEDCVIDNVYNR